jgi:hypothetical protein
MRAGKGGSDAYLDEWRRHTTSIESDESAQALAMAIGKAIEVQVTDAMLETWVKNNGFDEAN